MRYAGHPTGATIDLLFRLTVALLSFGYGRRVTRAGLLELIPFRTREKPKVNDRRIPPITPEGTTQDTTPVTIIQYHRLSREAYQELEKLLAAPQVNNLTTDIQAGWLLGIQQALKVVRDGFAVNA